MRSVAAALALLLLATAAEGSVALVQAIGTTPTTIAAPITLAAGSSGSTTLNTATTSASTTRTALANVAVEVLKVHRVSGSWDIKIRIDTATGTGMTVGNSATIREVLGATNLAEGTATAISGTALSITGTPGSVITLSGATDLSLQITSTHAVGATITLGMTILIVPNGGTAPTLSYSWTLLLN